MDCCGHGYAVTPRAWMWGMALTSIDAILAGEVGRRGSTAGAQAAETASDALAVLRKSISVDVHTHGGKTGVTSKAPPNDDLAHAMRAGSLAVACLADVPDGPVLGRNAQGVLAAVRTEPTGVTPRARTLSSSPVSRTTTRSGAPSISVVPAACSTVPLQTPASTAAQSSSPMR